MRERIVVGAVCSGVVAIALFRDYPWAAPVIAVGVIVAVEAWWPFSEK